MDDRRFNPRAHTERDCQRACRCVPCLRHRIVLLVMFLKRRIDYTNVSYYTGSTENVKRNCRKIA